MSKQWFRLLTERLDAVAVLYRVAALIAEADPERQPVRVDHYRQGPYDALLTLSGGRTIGILRQGPMLSAVQPALPPAHDRADGRASECPNLTAGADRLRAGHAPRRESVGRPPRLHDDHGGRLRLPT